MNILARRSLPRLRRRSLSTKAPNTYTVSQEVPCVPPQTLFAVVADVDAYKTFLPYCNGSSVTRIIGRKSGKFIFEADLDIGVEGSIFKEVYKSRVSLDRQKRAVDIAAIKSNLFDELRSTWVISEGSPPDSSLVDFSVEYRCSNWAVDTFVRPLFPEIARRQIEAFTARATNLVEDNKVD